MCSDLANAVLIIPIDSIPSEVIAVCEVMPHPLVPELLHVEGVFLQVLANDLLHLITVFEPQTVQVDYRLYYARAPVVLSHQLNELFDYILEVIG